jgi:ABC-type nitrate/sulfonate/bicarbonate transport system substrate-binding protein
MNLLRCACLALSAALVVAAVGPARAEEPFGKLVGDVTVEDVRPGKTTDLPFFTWGGDVATFHANGGAKETRPGTLFAQQGLAFNLIPGDDFVGQVKNYLAGKTPFLRGTMSQLGQASEVLGKDPRTRPVVFLQLTWSAGDHMVGRPTCKTLNDLKGKKIALQRGGPHVGMLDDVLRSVGLKWSDITPDWTDDVTGDKGPAAKFRKEASVDACFVITPDMTDLTGGLDKVGDGSEKSIKGAKVLVSTVTLSHSIADVYACRKDYYDKNKETIEKLTAAYLKACEELVEMKNNHDEKAKQDKNLDKKYQDLLKITQEIYGKEVIPDLDAAHGLVSDATFVALPGNYSFFKDEKNQVNFQNRLKAALDMAVAQGYAGKRVELAAADLDYDALKKRSNLKLEVRPARVPAIVTRPEDKPDDFRFDPEKDTVYFFTVQFDPDDPNFDIKKYESDFLKAIQSTALYGNAVVAIRGHVDPTRTLRQFVQAGLQKRFITREKSADGWQYYTRDGKPFDLTDTKKVLELIQKSDFSGAEENPKPTVEAAQKLSEARAARVLEALKTLAKTQGINLDTSQLKTQGVGITEPIIAVPKSPELAAKNRRVEFRILKVSPEKLSKKDFDF